MVSVGLLQCQAKGPPLKPLESGDNITLRGYYTFTPPRPFYRNQIGELLLSHNIDNPRQGAFILRIIGKSSAGYLALRSYEGIVRQSGNLLQMRAQRCYIYHKGDWKSRMVTAERWECDHIHFNFRSKEKLTAASILYGESSPETQASDWLGQFDLTPGSCKQSVIEINDPQNRKRIESPLGFVGQLFQGGKDGETLVFGHDLDLRLHSGMVLTAQTKNGQTRSRFKITETSGDFARVKIIKGGQALNETRHICAEGFPSNKSPSIFN